MSDSQEQVRNLFNLNKDEKILDDFGCSVLETLPILGRLYLTENYICFNSNIFGFSRKYVLAFNEITKLNKKNKGMIEIETNTPKKYTFNNFNDFPIVYKRIKSLFNSFNDNNKDKNTTHIILSDSDNSDDSGEDINKTPKKDNNTEITKKESKDLNNKNQNSSPSASPDNKKNDENKENSNINSNLSESNDKNSLANSVENNKKDNEEKNSNDNNSNNDDEEEIKFSKIEPDIEYEVCRKILKINPKDLFNKYFANSDISKDTSYLKFYESLGDHVNINFENWEKIENSENPEKFKRVVKFTINLNLPMVNKSDVVKTQTYWIEPDGTYIIKGSSQSIGIPFSDCYTVEDHIEIHPYMNNTKSVFRTTGKTNFVKSTFFKGMIQSQAKKSYEEEIEKWIKFVGDRDGTEGDYVYVQKKKKKVTENKPLNHGVEKVKSETKNQNDIKGLMIDIGKDCFTRLKKGSKNLYKRFEKEMDFKSMVIFSCFLLVILLMLSIISHQNSEIRELKKGFNEMKNVLLNLGKNDKN